jgi:hypothetical protein
LVKNGGKATAGIAIASRWRSWPVGHRRREKTNVLIADFQSEETVELIYNNPTFHAKIQFLPSVRSAAHCSFLYNMFPRLAPARLALNTSYREDVMEFNQQFVQFLIRAKQNTYAGHGSDVAPSRTASHDLRYEEGDFAYYDTYLGGLKFVGEEAVWVKGKPVWGMNYYGWMLVEEIPMVSAISQGCAVSRHT